MRFLYYLRALAGIYSVTNKEKVRRFLLQNSLFRIVLSLSARGRRRSIETPLKEINSS